MLSHCFAKRLRTYGGSQALELIFVCCDYYAELLCFKFCAKKIRIYYNGKRIHDSSLIRKLKLNGFYISGELKSIRLVFLSRDVLTLRLLQVAWLPDILTTNELNVTQQKQNSIHVFFI